MVVDPLQLMTGQQQNQAINPLGLMLQGMPSPQMANQQNIAAIQQGWDESLETIKNKGYEAGGQLKNTAKEAYGNIVSPLLMLFGGNAGAIAGPQLMGMIKQDVQNAKSEALTREIQAGNSLKNFTTIAGQIDPASIQRIKVATQNANKQAELQDKHNKWVAEKEQNQPKIDSIVRLNQAREQKAYTDIGLSQAYSLQAIANTRKIIEMMPIDKALKEAQTALAEGKTALTAEQAETLKVLQDLHRAGIDNKNAMTKLANLETTLRPTRAKTQQAFAYASLIKGLAASGQPLGDDERAAVDALGESLLADAGVDMSEVERKITAEQAAKEQQKSKGDILGRLLGGATSVPGAQAKAPAATVKVKENKLVQPPKAEVRKDLPNFNLDGIPEMLLPQVNSLIDAGSQYSKDQQKQYFANVQEAINRIRKQKNAK